MHESVTSALSLCYLGICSDAAYISFVTNPVLQYLCTTNIRDLVNIHIKIVYIVLNIYKIQMIHFLITLGLLDSLIELAHCN